LEVDSDSSDEEDQEEEVVTPTNKYVRALIIQVCLYIVCLFLYFLSENIMISGGKK